MNKKLSIIIGSFVIAGVIFASFIPSVLASKSNNVIGIPDVIEGITSNNSELKVLYEKIKLAEKRYDNSLDEKDQKGKTQLETDRREEVYPLEKKKEWNDLKWQKDQRTDAIVSRATELYYSIIIEDELIDIQNKNIERLNKELEEKKQQVNLGTLPKVSLLDYEFAVKEAQSKLENLKHDKESMKMELNMKMGNSVDTEFQIKKEEVPECDYKVENLNEAIEKLIKNSYEISSFKDTEVMLIQNKNLTKQNNGSGDYDNEVKDLEDELVSLSYDKEDKIAELSYKAQNDYNNLIALQNEIDSKKIDYDNKVKLLEVAKSKKEAGVSTNLEYNKAEEDVELALYQYKKSRLNYYIAVENFKNFINP